MDEAWPNAPSLEMDAWFFEILIFFFGKDDDDDDDLLLSFSFFFVFFENEWGMAECP